MLDTTLEFQWVSIPNYPGYQVSTDGVILNDRGEVLEPSVRNGELWVEFAKYEWSFMGPVWRVMLLAFYEGADQHTFVEYLDGDPNNLRLENLDFMEENSKSGQIWSIPVKKMARKFRFDRRIGQKVQIVETGEVFISSAKAAEAIGGQAPNITACLKGRLKTHKGYTFRYI